MFSKITDFKGIGPRLIFSTTLLLFVSLSIVSATIYFLLATSLRNSDKDLLLRLRQSYGQSFLENGPASLEGKVSPEVMLSIVDKKGNVVFEHMPSYIDHDFEDDDEIEQLEEEGRKIPLEEGWKNILLLSGEEKKDLIEQFEYQLRLFVQEKEWDSLLPIIDNDLIEVHVAPINDEFWMKIGRSSEEREEHLSSIRYIAFMVFVPFLFVGIILSMLVAKSVLAPIRELAETIKNQTQGNAMARGRIRGSGDEIDLLTSEFNALLDRNQMLLTNIKNTVDNVAHDMRTPLTRFKAGAEEALLKAKEPQRLREALQDALENSDRMLELLNAVMDVTEAETQIMSLKREQLRLADVIQDLTDLYQYVAEEKGIKILCDVPEDLYVEGDRIRLLQALSNLVDNGIKYSDPGSSLTIRGWKEGESVHLSFKDEGHGIAPEDLGRIWDRLYRADKSRSTPGLGIGLSLVKAILKRHDGDIIARSILGKGTEFVLTLPICHVPERAG